MYMGGNQQLASI